MSEKILKGRSVQKHDTEANWLKATKFIPKQGEIIIYDKDSTHSYERVKVGDGATVVSSLPFIDDNKVDKVSGKGLSTNDYTTTEKNKLAGIDTGANKTVVDTALSSTSTNPVQNKVVNAAISNLDTKIGEDSVAEQINAAVSTKANTSDLTSHTGNTTAHITSTERTNWNAAKTHADSAHAPSNAQPNQNAFSNVKVGDKTIAADNTTDTLTLTAGSNITLTADTSGDGVTIAATDTHYTSKNIVGASATANANAQVTLNGVYLNHLEESTVKSAHKIVGDGSVTVTSDASGNITIKGTDKDTVTTATTSGSGNAVTAVTANNGALTVTKGETFATKQELNTLSDQVGEGEVSVRINNAVANKVDKVDGKGLSTNDLTTALKANYDAAYTHTSKTDNPHSVTKSQVGLSNVENKSSATIRGEITSANVTNALGYTPASLDTNGKVPTSQLPSYVDDVLEYDKLSDFPATGETGKIYIAKDSNKTYRWSGSAYVVISETLALGETSSTAYAGDKGKANAAAIKANENAIAALDAKIGEGDVPTQIDTAIKEHKHTKSQITDFPTSMPASDVSAWAKAANKPTYTYEEVGAAASGHKHDQDYAAIAHGDHVTYSTTNPVMDGTASVGSATTVARSDHKHPTDTTRAAASDVTALTTKVGALESKVGDTEVATQITNALVTKADKANGVYVVTTAGDGSAYTATVPSITALTAGVSFIMIPHVVSASTTPTLNVNGLGAKNIKRRLSNLATSLQAGSTNTWLAKDKPFRVTYDGTAWVVEGHEKPAAADIYGLTATITELNYTSGVTSGIQGQINSLSSEIANLESQINALVISAVGVHSGTAEPASTLGEDGDVYLKV